MRNTHASQLAQQEQEHLLALQALQARHEHDLAELASTQRLHLDELARRTEQEREKWNAETVRVKEQLERQVAELKETNAVLVQDKQKEWSAVQKELQDKLQTLSVLDEQVRSQFKRGVE